jgi:hypothetical protein
MYVAFEVKRNFNVPLNRDYEDKVAHLTADPNVTATPINNEHLVCVGWKVEYKEPVNSF